MEGPGSEDCDRKNYRGSGEDKIDQWDEEKLREMQPQPKESGSKRWRGEAIDEGEAYDGKYLAGMRLFTAATAVAEEAVEHGPRFEREAGSHRAGKAAIRKWNALG
jgi:hypothetical protein